MWRYTVPILHKLEEGEEGPPRSLEKGGYLISARSKVPCYSARYNILYEVCEICCRVV